VAALAATMLAAVIGFNVLALVIRFERYSAIGFGSGRP
jgi:hypothetical protein